MKAPLICILSLCLSCLSGTLTQAQNNADMSDKFRLVIHGGAGTILKKNMTEELEERYKAKLTEALLAGAQVLESGGTSIEAVQAAINVMEDSPLFNAGKGAVFTSEGTNEMDASIMDGKTLSAGAVAGVRRVRNPINAARTVMEKSPHVMLAGRGADEFAREQGLELETPAYFRDETRYEQWKKVRGSEKSQLDHDAEPVKKTNDSGSGSGNDGEPTGALDPSEVEFNVNIDINKELGTVGAVAWDRDGNLAAGTSTGGMTNKRWGRVGDSPIIAAGTYANNNTCAVSCTGHGEYFIRSVVAYDVSALMDYKNLSLEKAANEVVQKKLKEMGGSGGLIAIDRAGNYTMEFNTPGMYRGTIDHNGNIQIGIYQK